jgi:hypothetical protein
MSQIHTSMEVWIMATPSDPGLPEGDYVDIDNDDHVEMWTRSLGISRHDLQRAVEIAGPAAGNVYDYIKRGRSGRTV